MKRSIVFLSVLAVLFVFVSTGIAEETGESLFNSMGCGSCHQPETSTKVNPSVAKIAQAYQGNKQQLVDYLNGESEPILDPARANLMKSSLRRTKELSDAEREALADYMLSQ